MKRLVLGTMVASLAAACGQLPGAKGPQSTSRPDYISLGNQTAGLVGHVKKPTMLICLAGASQADEAVWSGAIKKILLSWVQPLRSLTSDKLTSAVEVTTTGGDCDAAVNVVPGTWSNTQIGDQPITTMDADGYFSSYNVLAHEFGHQFALGDTYTSGGQSGQCIPGEPRQAIMCDTSYSGPQPDDVAGITEIFQATFPNDRPGTPTTGTPLAVSLYVALGAASGPDLYSLALAVVGAPGKGDGTLSVCLDEAAACAKVGAAWTDVARSATAGDSMIYRLDGPFKMKAGLALTARYRTVGGDEATQSVHFRPIP